MVVAIQAHRIAYMAVPKAACSSVKAALAGLDPGVSADTIARFETDIMAVHRLYPTRRFHPGRWRRHDGWFRFTVVRDPLKRMLSVYTDLIAGRRILHDSTNFQRGHAPLPQDPDPDTFYLRLDDYMHWASAVKHHALPMRLFSGTDLAAYDRVYRTGEMDALAADLARRTGCEVTIPRLNESRVRLDFGSLRPQTRDALRSRLVPEYDLYGSLFELPW